MNQFYTMSDEQLLGLIIAESPASKLLDTFENLEESLVHSEPEELKKIKGLGDRQVQRLKAVAEISRRLYSRPLLPGITIRKPADVYDHYREMQLLKQEQIRVICLNTKNGVLSTKIIIIGGVDRGVVEPREIFQLPIRLMAKAIIAVHNHPSGDPTPSEDDIILTRRLAECGQFLGIPLIDHLIIGRGEYRSLKELGHIKY